MPALPDAPSAEVGVAGFEASPWARERNLASFPEFIAAVLREGRSENGVFASSLQWSSFGPMLEKLRTFTPYGGTARIRPLLRKYFGPTRWIYLDRRDREGQARSWGHAILAARGEADAGVPVALQRGLRSLIDEAHEGWESLFDLLEVYPLRLTLEDWRDDRAGAVNEVLRWLQPHEPEEPRH